MNSISDAGPDTPRRDHEFELLVATILSELIDESDDVCREYEGRLAYESALVSAAIRLARYMRRDCAL